MASKASAHLCIINIHLNVLLLYVIFYMFHTNPPRVMSLAGAHIWIYVYSNVCVCGIGVSHRNHYGAILEIFKQVEDIGISY
jgi:hypothetical protein